jgi:Uma2 family endonuclease
MAEPALRRMTLDDFLRWEDGTDTRYELLGGFVVAMAPPAPVHSALAARLTAKIEAALATRRPCLAFAEAGIVRPDRADDFFVADIAVSCTPIVPRAHMVANPILIVEILSPRTELHDRRIKLPAYRAIPSVQEILLVGSYGQYAELHRRSGAQWITELYRAPEETISLASVGTEISMSELYDGITFDDDQLAS